MCARDVQRDRWKRRRVKSDSLRVKIMRGGILDGMRNCFEKIKIRYAPHGLVCIIVCGLPQFAGVQRIRISVKFFTDRTCVLGVLQHGRN